MSIELTDSDLMKVIIMSFLLGRGTLGATREEIFDAVQDIKSKMPAFMDEAEEHDQLEWEI